MAVRMKPLRDLPISLVLAAEGQSPIELDVADVSVGGFGVHSRSAPVSLIVGSRHHVRVGVLSKPPFDATVEVRHRSGDPMGLVGLMIVDGSSAITAALGRYVAELLERGALS